MNILRGLVRTFYFAAGLFFVIVVVAWLNSPSTRSTNTTPVEQKDARPLTSAEERGFQMMDVAAAQLRQCIRSSIEPAYATGIYGRAQFLTFMKSRCYPPFYNKYMVSGLNDVEALDAIYGLIIEQEIAALRN